MSARALRLFLSTVVAVAITLPLFPIAETARGLARHHSSRHWPVPQQRATVAPVRDAQSLAARISALKELSRRSRASQPILLTTAHHSTAGTTVARLFSPLRC
jgi:hypothetical protein